MKRPIRTLSLLASLSAAGLLSACGGGGGGVSSTAPGTLGVAMTDAPSCGYDAVNVTVNKVRVNKSATASDTDAGWTDITLSPAKKINLLNLTNGVLEDLGQTSLEAGHYTQLRLVLDPNTGNGLANSVVVTGTTTEVSLDTPSAVQSGLKLAHEFDVASGQRVDLVLDFDACKSIVARGNGKFGLKPVVNVIPTVLNGISGFVAPTSNLMVTAQQNGVVVRATVPNPTTGEFFLARIPTGNYDVVFSADNKAASVIAAVPVPTTTSNVPVSTVGLPIVLQPSLAMHSISGTVTLPAGFVGTAVVAAQQTFAAGPKVTVKYRGIDLTTPQYTLANLPTSAPLLAQYSAAGQVFAAKTDTVPGTAKYAVEASGTGLAAKTVSPVDLTTADQAAVNFSF
ncbi:MAG: DUF4382 domain-containing protein [Herminiimonas sp.]|nr:DUF4382 domain-containing protein [Herminiimonas sp.]